MTIDWFTTVIGHLQRFSGTIKPGKLVGEAFCFRIHIRNLV